MSSLIVLCPQCLTWGEPHADRCTECGVAVDVDAPDPDDDSLALRLGEPLRELGPVRLDRSGWPSLGSLVATSAGLLFLPDFVARPNGAIEPCTDEPDADNRWIAPLSLSWWWPQRSSRVQASPLNRTSSASGTDAEDTSSRPVFQRLLDAPGGLFVARPSVRHLLARWNRLQIERRPSRSVTLRPVPRGASVGELVRQLRELAVWRDV